MKTKTLFLICFFCQLSLIKAQDPHFTMYKFQPMYQNPALTGSFSGDLRVNLNHRQQWATVSEPYTTSHFSVDGCVRRTETAQFCIGAFIIDDRAGASDFRQLQPSLNMSAAIRVGEKSSIAAGIGAGVFSQSIHSGDLMWASQYNGMNYDPALSSGESIEGLSSTKFDVHAGMAFKFQTESTNMSSNDGVKGEFGISAFHLNQPQQVTLLTEDSKHVRLAAHAEMSIGIEATNSSVEPSFVVLLQGTQKEFLPGISFRQVIREESKYTHFVKKSALTLGCQLRTKDAVNILTFFELNNMAIGFSYDINISDFSKATNGTGAFEFAIRYMIIGKTAGGTRNAPIF